jgi:hypothetical protein
MLSIGWPKIGIGWNIENRGYSTWTSCLDSTIGSTISTCSIGSTWMLSIT